MPATLYSARLLRTMMLLRLADIDARVGRARDGDAVDQHVGRFDRIDAVGAVLGLGGPPVQFDLEVLVGDVVGALGLDAVALGVLHREAGERDAVGRDQQALARPVSGP